jgi:hypothetical protein
LNTFILNLLSFTLTVDQTPPKASKARKSYIIGKILVKAFRIKTEGILSTPCATLFRNLIPSSEARNAPV